jgi:hypothetical protein
MVRKVVLILALGLICMAAAYAEACYSSVSTVPATCTGGSISQDTVSGNCRTLVCASGSNSVKVLACDKPDTGTKQYFEMYRQSYSGVIPKLCLDGACIQYNGYQKSTNYPICTTKPPFTGDNAETGTPSDKGWIVTGSGNITYSIARAHSGSRSLLSDTKNGPVEIPLTGFHKTIDGWVYDDGIIPTSGLAYGGQNTWFIFVGWNEATHPGVIEYWQTDSHVPTTIPRSVGWHRAQVYLNPATNRAILTWDGKVLYDGVGSHLSEIPANLQLSITNNRGYFDDILVYDGLPNLPSITNSTTCYSRVNDLPASCSGGTITRDDKGGCRTIVCSNGGNSLQTLACDKGGYFEMYRQTQVGSTAFNICIGNTCLGNSGYAKSANYPVCIVSNNTNTTLPPQNVSGTVQLVIDPLSKDLNFIFSCNVTGFKAKSYTFNFGDGASETKNESIYYPYKYNYNTGGQYNVTGVKAMHFLPGEKTYAVSCTATDGINTATKTLSVSPITPYMPPDYQYSPQFGSYLTIARIANSTYNITVHTIGFVPDYLAYWQIHDPNNNSAYIYGQEQGMSNIVAVPYPATWNVGVDTASFEHGYESNHYESCLGENGYDYCEYEATICGRSHLGCMSLSNWKDLIVPSSDFQTTQSNAQTTVTIASGYPQGNNYIFNCNAFNFTPTKYDFTFGDGQSWSNVTFNNSYHSYPNAGSYQITCTAKNDQISRTGSLTINVGGSTTSNSTCYNKVNDIPANCTGGSITTDNKAGCRTLICTNGGSNMQVLACDKSGFFEMYKQSQTGTAVSKICIGTTCISDNGYAKSVNYPICS